MPPSMIPVILRTAFATLGLLAYAYGDGKLAEAGRTCFGAGVFSILLVLQ